MKISIAEVEAAADTLEKLSKIYDYTYPHKCEWSPETLRSEIPHLAEYIQQWDLREEIAHDIASRVFSGTDLLQAVQDALADFEVRREG